MIERLDQKTKDRVNKAIRNIRLIASRSKRALLLDATQKAETVVTLLNDFRQYINWSTTFGPDTTRDDYFAHRMVTPERVRIAVEEASDLYAELSHSKQVSYKEEYKQVWLLLGDLRDYLTKIINGSVPDA